MRHSSSLLLVCGFLLGACGDESSSDALRVTSTTPADGATNVAADTSITISFSEAMATTSGDILVVAGAEQVPLDVANGVWNNTATSITFTLTEPFLFESEVTVTVQTSFESVGGTPLPAPVDFSFGVGSNLNAAPTVVSSTPAEGATVSATTSTITITFSEAMAQSGTVTLAGGPGVLAAPVWAVDGTSTTIDVEKLAYDTVYQITLAGFADTTAIALQGGVLGDLVLDFSTGSDTDAPVVVSSDPIEGMLDVINTIPTIQVTFSEVMDTSVVTAPLFDGKSTTTLSGGWSEDGTSITFSVSEGLGYETAYSLDLSGFADVLGNALDGTPVLGDGSLDFVTAEFVDVFAPFLIDTTPAEGETGVSITVGTISLSFVEVMNTTVTDVVLTTSAGTQTLTGTWDESATVIFFTLGDLPIGEVSLAVDAAGFQDLAGNPLDAAVLLVDGNLDFSTEATYTGVTGIIESFGVTFPTSATSEYWIAVNATTIFMGGPGNVWTVPLAGGTAVNHSTGDGITIAMTGEGGVWANGALFTLDDTTSLTLPRLFRLWDGVASPWAPIAWDTGSVYLADDFNQLSFDGTNLIAVTNTTASASFFSWSATTAGPATNLGMNTHIKNCFGTAADDEYFYAACQTVATPVVEGIFRVDRAAITAAPLALAVAPAVNLSAVTTQIMVDDFTNPDNLYFMNYDPHQVHVIAHPDDPAPIHMGSIAHFGGVAGDYSLGIDYATGWLYHFDSTVATPDTIVRIH